MSRPFDKDGDFSPREIVFMDWVGDEHGIYDGLKIVLRYMLQSGTQNYVGFGSDIGGFLLDMHSDPLGRTKELFLRWTAVGALSLFMENGGMGEHLPWNFDNETVDIYRSWVNLNYRLVPYLYSEETKVAIGQNGTLMKPCNDSFAISSQSYFLDPNIYVVPVPHDPSPGQLQLVWLPKSSTQKWINYFNTLITYKSETFIQEDTSRLDRIPLYVEQNILMPMYDTKKSPSLNAYRFVLWGKVISNIQTATLFTRDGEQWLIEFNLLQRKFSVHSIEQYQLLKKEKWIWKVCQYVSQQEICSEDWIDLYDNVSIELNSLVTEE